MNISRSTRRTAGLGDVITRIMKKVKDGDLARDMVERVTRYFHTKNPADDLSREDVRILYRDDDYGDDFDVEGGREMDVGWTDHAEYRSDLRDIEPSLVNEAVRDFADRNVGKKDKRKVNLIKPGVGKAVVDVDMGSDPEKATVVTVMARSNMNRFSKIMERIADTFPIGLSEKGMTAFLALKKAVENKMIFNVDYDEIKFILSRNFEKWEDTNRGELSYFLYKASDSLLNLNNINKYARDVRKYNKKDAEDLIAKIRELHPQYEPTREMEMLANFDNLKKQSEKYLQDVETWSVVVSMLKEVKPYVVKGRKPIERGPDYVPRIYVPPMAGQEAVDLIKGKLLEIVEPQREDLIKKISDKYIDMVKSYSGEMDYKILKDYLQKVGMDGTFSLIYESDSGYGKNKTFIRKKDYHKNIVRFVEGMVQDMINRYVEKNTGKISPIIHAKGEPSNVKVRWGNLQGWGFGGAIDFKFLDGTGFTVNNQAVMKFSSGGMFSQGKQFFQFPTTFHDVIFKDGSNKAMVSEQEMNEVWAK